MFSLTKLIESIGVLPELSENNDILEDIENKEDFKENQNVTFILGYTNERTNVERRDC